MKRHFVSLLVIAGMLSVTGCQKDVTAEIQPATTHASTNTTPQLTASCSRVLLFEGNAKSSAIDFSWPAFSTNNAAERYTIEAALAGDQFSNPVQIATTNSRSMNITVADLNHHLRNLSIPGVPARFEFRILMRRETGDVTYSQGVGVEVSTYDEYKDYPASSIFRLPGNYQNWDVYTAPQAISANADGEYEGYVKMFGDKPLFVLVKGATSFDYANMYYDIGNGKFGKGQYVFMLPADGIYKVNLSTNSKQWVCTRIENFSLYGSATDQSDLAMEYNNATQTWSATINLKAGDFSFRANRNDKIRLGAVKDDEPGSLESNGSNINVKATGKYRVVLSVLSAGNYKYGLQRVF